MRSKIIFYAVLMLAAIGIGLAAGFALRAKRIARISQAEATTFAGANASRESGTRVSNKTPKPHMGDDSPLTTKLEHDLAKSTGVTRWLYWLEALEKATPQDFPRLARLAKNNPAALQFVAARWTEIAPRHLFNWLLAAAEDRNGLPVRELAQVLFKEWPKSDPEGAIAALNEASDSGMRRQWQMSVATTIINQNVERGLLLFSDWNIENYMPFFDGKGPVPKWTAADPLHAAQFAVDHPQSAYLSEGIMKAIGEEWGKTDPAGALRFAAARPGGTGSALGSAALRTWAEGNLDQAADWLSETDDRTRDRFSAGFVEAWAKKDSAGALAWCQENFSGSSLTRMMGSVVQGAGVENVAQTAGLVAAMEPSPARAEAAVAVARLWFPMLGGMSGPSGAQTVSPQTVSWLAGLDADSIRRVLNEETWSWATSDPQSMGNFLLMVTNQAAGDWADTCLARQMAQKNPAAALDWASRLPGNRSLTAGGEAYAEWRSSQPEAATQWLNELPADDARRDPFFRSAIRLLAYNPQAPEQLASMTPAERAAARGVIEGMSLADDRRTRLLAALGSR